MKGCLKWASWASRIIQRSQDVSLWIPLGFGAFPQCWRRAFCGEGLPVALVKKWVCPVVLCCLAIVVRFWKEVPLEWRIRYQWLCSALLNLELLNYSTLQSNEENHLNYLCFNRSSPHLSTNGVSSFSGKTGPPVIQGTVEVLTALRQDLQNSGRTDAELWKNYEVSHFALFWGSWKDFYFSGGSTELLEIYV